MPAKPDTAIASAPTIATAPALSNAARHGQVFGLAGWSGAGKTTLAEKLIAEFTRRGLAVASIKHAHHNFDPDTPGKDSWRHRKAGAKQVLVASSIRRMLVTEYGGGSDGETTPELNALLGELAAADIVLVEGFKAIPFAKIEIRRRTQPHATPLHQTHPGIIAIASDAEIADCPLPCLDLNNVAAIADFILGLREAK